MRVFNRSHVPWIIFVVLATMAAFWIYLGNFQPERLPATFRVPSSLLQNPSDHRSIGGTPLGLVLGTISLGIFVVLYTVNADIIVGLIPTSRDISVQFYRSRRSRSIGLNASSS